MRIVRAKDGRSWAVQSRISWTKPEMADQFEHDIAAGYLPGASMLGVIVVLTLLVVFLTPAGVVVPAWFVLLILLILLLVLVSWAMQRPWIITAYTTEPLEADSERWQGIVHGVIPAREEILRVSDDLQMRNVPDNGTGPLSRLAH
ncbi:MAG: DUF983 domain-containing protein [Pseudonocardiaceae bacterium]